MVKKLMRLHARSILGAPEPFSTVNGAFTLAVLAGRKKEQHVALALMIPLVMKMRHILRQRMTERCFPKENDPRQALLLHGAHPPLCVGVEIRRPRRQRDPLDPCVLNDPLKRRAVLAVSVVNQILPWRQKTPLLHGHVACHLDLPTAQMDEE